MCDDFVREGCANGDKPLSVLRRKPDPPIKNVVPFQRKAKGEVAFGKHVVLSRRQFETIVDEVMRQVESRRDRRRA